MAPNRPVQTLRIKDVQSICNVARRSSEAARGLYGAIISRRKSQKRLGIIGCYGAYNIMQRFKIYRQECLITATVLVVIAALMVWCII